MEKFVRSFVPEDSMYSTIHLLANVDFNVESNIIKFLQKIIFKQDVLAEWKTAISLVSSAEKFTIQNDIIKQAVVQLKNLLLLDLDDKIKSDGFCIVFVAFALTCRKEESIVTIQFFVLLCHILGINELLKEDNEENDEVLPLVNEETFESAFEVSVAECSQTSIFILKELLQAVSKQTLSINSQEMQPYLKWLQTVVRNLSKSDRYQDFYSVDILCICIDIDVKFVESNMEFVFSNIFQRFENLDEKFCESYKKFLDKTLKTFEKYQRVVKFITKFLSFLKEISGNIDPEMILPGTAIMEYSRILTLLSNQQSTDLLSALLQHLQDACNQLPTDKGKKTLTFEVTCHLLISFLKEVKVYSPSTSIKSLRSFIKELNHLKDILQDFGKFILKKPKLLEKNEKILQQYLELSFYYYEIQALIHCYKNTYFQSLASDSQDSYMNLEQWNNLVGNYFKNKFQMCQPLFFRMTLQRIRVARLMKEDFETADSILDTIFTQSTKFNIFTHMTSEDMSFLIEILPVTNSRKLVNKFLQQILNAEDVTKALEWLSESRLAENSSFNVSLFAELMEEINLVLSGVLSRQGSKIMGLSKEFFDENNNVMTDKMECLPKRINMLMEKSKKISKATKGLGEDERSRLHRMIIVFKYIPLVYMDVNLKRLGLGLAVELAVLSAQHSDLAEEAFEKLYDFLGRGIEIKFCFDVQHCFSWLCGLSCTEDKINRLRVKIIERLVKYCSSTKSGLDELNSMIEERHLSKNSVPMKVLELQVAMYEELGKSAVGKKKRKAEDKGIEDCRTKLAKIIREDVVHLGEPTLTEDNYKLLFKTVVIELQKGSKDDISKILALKFSSYFDFAINKLKQGYDEPCSRFLLVLLQMTAQIKAFTPNDILQRIWSVLKYSERSNWKIFALNSSNEEYENILADVLNITKASFGMNSSSHKSTNFFDIWKSFLALNSDSRRNLCQIELQKFFRHIHNCPNLLATISVAKKTSLMDFLCYCLSSNKIIVTSHMLETMVDVILHCPDDPTLTNEDFHGLFVKQMEVASLILLRHFTWNKSRVHLSFVFFQKMLNDLTKRSDVSLKPCSEDVFFLSDCGLSLEKWINHLNKMKKDFARISPYFIAAVITSITTVTVLPAVKIHLVNSVNVLLSMADSHTIAYLLRVLKPGCLQVFTSIHSKFKKYHKYSGKV